MVWSSLLRLPNGIGHSTKSSSSSSSSGRSEGGGGGVPLRRGVSVGVLPRRQQGQGPRPAAPADVKQTGNGGGGVGAVLANAAQVQFQNVYESAMNAGSYARDVLFFAPTAKPGAGALVHDDEETLDEEAERDDGDSMDEEAHTRRKRSRVAGMDLLEAVFYGLGLVPDLVKNMLVHRIGVRAEMVSATRPAKALGDSSTNVEGKRLSRAEMNKATAADMKQQRDADNGGGGAGQKKGEGGGANSVVEMTKIDSFLEKLSTKKVKTLRICSSLSACTYSMRSITADLLYEKHRLRLVKKRMRSTATTSIDDETPIDRTSLSSIALEGDDDDDYILEDLVYRDETPETTGVTSTAASTSSTSSSGLFRFNFGLGLGNDDSEAVTRMLNDTMDYSESKWEEELLRQPIPADAYNDGDDSMATSSVWRRATTPIANAVGSAAETLTSSAAAYSLSRVKTALVGAVASATGNTNSSSSSSAPAAALEDPVSTPPMDVDAARKSTDAAIASANSTMTSVLADASSRSRSNGDIAVSGSNNMSRDVQLQQQQEPAKQKPVSAREVKETKYKPVVTVTKAPTEWFIADDDEKRVRYFVIQGSDSIDCWRANLTFDPVPFENPGLGVSIHRGVYEAAVALYDEILPFVQAHLAAHPLDTPKLAFTGHSLGGSLATVVGLMLVLRGDVPLSALNPIVTFGAAAIFCSDDCCRYSQRGDTSKPCSSILEKMQVPDDIIVNVMMHLDIVPRAFACDYSLVVDIFKRLVAFKDHSCLMTGSRRVMYTPVGETYVMQPSTANAPQHPLLPEGLGIYRMRDPPLWESLTDKLVMKEGGLLAKKGEEEEGPSYVKSSTSLSGYSFRRAKSVSDALFGLLNTPHPLDILADPNAYGPKGNISLYHNPYNYTSALNDILRLRLGGGRSGNGN